MDNQSDGYNVVDSRTDHIGRFDIVCDTIREQGREYPYSYVKIKDCAAVLCIMEGKVLLLKQYRHTLKSWEYEIPAGSVEMGEEPAETAKREVLEETGYRVERLLSLGWYHLSVGSTTEKVYLFQAECGINEGQHLDVLERIQIYRFTFDKFEKLIDEGEFHQCMGVTAWERYKRIIRL